jgi:hypothetical protein
MSRKFCKLLAQSEADKPENGKHWMADVRHGDQRCWRATFSTVSQMFDPMPRLRGAVTQIRELMMGANRRMDLLGRVVLSASGIAN